MARALHEGFGAKNYDSAASVVADDFEWKMIPSGMILHGCEGFRQGYESFAAAFPKSQFHYKNVLDSGNEVVVEYDFVGTQNGALLTPLSAVPPTGRVISWAGIEAFRIHNGKIVSLHTYFDTGTIMAQLGLLPQT